MLSDISAQTQEQDAILEELSKGLDELKQQADNINDEVRLTMGGEIWYQRRVAAPCVKGGRSVDTQSTRLPPSSCSSWRRHRSLMTVSCGSCLRLRGREGCPSDCCVDERCPILSSELVPRLHPLFSCSSAVDGKTDKVQAKLDRTNDRMKEALKLVNDKSSNCVRKNHRLGAGKRLAHSHCPSLPCQCSYIICICILLGIASVALKLSGKV